MPGNGSQNGGELSWNNEIVREVKTKSSNLDTRSYWAMQSLSNRSSKRTMAIQPLKMGGDHLPSGQRKDDKRRIRV